MSDHEQHEQSIDPEIPDDTKYMPDVLAAIARSLEDAPRIGENETVTDYPGIQEPLTALESLAEEIEEVHDAYILALREDRSQDAEKLRRQHAALRVTYEDRKKEVGE